MKLFLDTNIVIDYLDERPNSLESTKKLMLLGILHEFDLWMGASQVTDAFYILTNGGRASQAESVKEDLRQLRKFIHICSLTEEDVDSVLTSAWCDFEDACIYQCASKIKANAIISRNKKDFKKSSIKVFDCEEWFDYLKETQGLLYEEYEI